MRFVCFRYAEEAPDEDESDAPQLVPLTAPAAVGDSSKAEGGKPVAASEGTPLLADRIGELALCKALLLHCNE